MKKFTIVYGFRDQKIHARKVISAHNLNSAKDICNEDYPFYDIISIYDDKSKLLANFSNETWTS